MHFRNCCVIEKKIGNFGYFEAIFSIVESSMEFMENLCQFQFLIFFSKCQKIEKSLVT